MSGICVECGIEPIHEGYADEELCITCAELLDDEQIDTRELNFSENIGHAFARLNVTTEVDDGFYQDGIDEGWRETGC